jgi:D-alanine-D-alanine ligase
MGGISSEREISLKTGEAVLNALKKKGYKAIGVYFENSIPDVLLEKKVEVVFIALHGRYGEDGTIQGILEILKIPYTGSGVLSSALAMDKVMAKMIFRSYLLPVLPDQIFYKNEDQDLNDLELKLDFPLVVKPAREGSTVGTSITKNRSELKEAIIKAQIWDKKILFEKYAGKREITVGILSGKILPIIEIVPESGFYDYDSKYIKGKTRYILPAQIEKERQKYINEISLKAYLALDCRGAVRVDLILDERENPYILELNTIPGMTETSLLPKAASKAGMKFPDLIEEILLSADLMG